MNKEECFTIFIASKFLYHKATFTLNLNGKDQDTESLKDLGSFPLILFSFKLLIIFALLCLLAHATYILYYQGSDSVNELCMLSFPNHKV